MTDVLFPGGSKEIDGELVEFEGRKFEFGPSARKFVCIDDGKLVALEVTDERPELPVVAQVKTP